MRTPVLKLGAMLCAFVALYNAMASWRPFIKYESAELLDAEQTAGLAEADYKDPTLFLTSLSSVSMVAMLSVGIMFRVGARKRNTPENLESFLEIQKSFHLIPSLCGLIGPALIGAATFSWTDIAENELPWTYMCNIFSYAFFSAIYFNDLQRIAHMEHWVQRVKDGHLIMPPSPD